MTDNKLKIKFNVSPLKWATTVFFLSGNFMLIYTGNAKMFYLWWEISVNGMAIFAFVMLSIFPRRYCIFDGKGCSIQKSNGKEYAYVNWDDVDSLEFVYCLFYPEGLLIKWKEHCINKQIIRFPISKRHAKKVYDTIPEVKALMIHFD